MPVFMAYPPWLRVGLLCGDNEGVALQQLEVNMKDSWVLGETTRKYEKVTQFLGPGHGAGGFFRPPLKVDLYIFLGFSWLN